MTERMYATSKGLESSGGERDPDAETFAKFFEEHYDEFAKESPQLAHLKELGKVFGLVKWLHSNRIPISVDPQWVQNAGGLERQYVERVSALSRQQQRTKQYRSGNALITETRVIHIFGGDAVQTEPREIQDDGSAARLSGIMQNARVGKLERPDVSIEAGGKQLTAVVLPLTTNGKQLWDNAKAPTTVERQGVTYHFGPDRKVKYAEDDFGTRIDYRRDNKGNLTGYQAKSSDGWASVASSQSFGTQLAITSPRKDRFSYCWNAEDYLTDVIVNDKPFARCAYDPAQRTANMSYAGHIETLTFDSDNRLQNWMVEQTIGKAGTKGSLTMNYDSDGQITNVRTDTGDKLEVAYENGTVRSIRTAGNEVEYSWSDNKRLASVRSGDLSANYAYDGDSLREVNIQRGDAVASAIFENGLLQKVSDLSGGAWSYRYDTQDALIAVRDATGAEGRYSYDADGRLTDVRLPGGGRLQYVYEQLASKEGKGNGAAEGVRLIGVTFSPEGQGLPFQGHAKTQRTFPWGASGLAGLAVFVSLAAIWWYRRWPETRR
jgi:YD repeat-containing protein